MILISEAESTILIRSADSKLGGEMKYVLVARLIAVQDLLYTNGEEKERIYK